MITVKSAREIDLMREAGRIVALTHQELQKHLKPGISTLELDEIAEKTIRSYGATPSFKGYGGFPGSICASINEVVVHGIPKKNIILHDGDIIALDIGACYKGYHGDSAWSYAVGNVSDEAKKLLEETKIRNQEKLLKIRKNIINYKRISLEYLNKLEKDNFDINENNKELICYKINFLNEINNEKYLDKENLATITEQIVNENNLDKIKKGIATIKYQKELIDQMDYAIRNTERPSKMSIEERKINKDLLESAKRYFNQKYKLSY